MTTRDDNTISLEKINQSADFWFYEVGSNPLPADTKNKVINVKWGESQNKSISNEVHELRKRNRQYSNGIAVMTGRIHKGKNEGKYLIGIDCDNKKAIGEICEALGYKDINELSNWTRVEQHKDNINKAHIYILATKPFKNKGKDPKKTELETKNEVPTIEIKCERQTMFTSPSKHEDGYPYEILGKSEPILCNEFETHLDNIFRKYNIEYLYHSNNEENNNNYNNNLPDLLRQLIILLEIPPNYQVKIHEGARHATLLSFANKLLFKYKFDNNNTNNGDKLKTFFNEVNDKICNPPLPQNELNSIWEDALKFSDTKITEMQIINEDENDTQNYKSPIFVPLEKTDKLLEREIVQNLVYDIQINSIDCTLNSKYDLTKIIVPINIKQWPDVRKTFRKLCEEKGIVENDIVLLLESIDNNIDLIKKHYLENHRKHIAALAAAEERRKQRVELIEEGTDFVMAKYRFLTIEENREILFYDTENGVYVHGGEIIIEKELDKKYGYKLKTADITEIKNYVIRKTYVKKQEFDFNLDIVNLTNGLYNWKTDEFLPHSPDYYSLNQKPFPYNPEAKPKLFIKFLEQVLYPQDIRTALELIAYTFIRVNLFEYYFILIGTGANGKSVFIGVLSNLHGLKNISNVPLHSLVNDRFALADLENKDVNVDTELSSSTINEMSALKRLTGKQPTRIQRKGQHAYDALLWAKHIFNANQLPRTSDESDAHYRREIVISFPRQFQGKNDDPNLLKKLTTEEELSGIFNIIIKCLRTINNRNEIYVNSKSISERRKRVELTRDPVTAFLDVAISKEPKYDDFETKDNFYNAFVKFCNKKKLPVLSYDEFAKILKKEHSLTKTRKMIVGKKQTIWNCVKLVKFKNIADPSQQTLETEDEDDSDDEEK